MKALVVANGCVDVNHLNEIYDKYDYIIACDGGYDYIYDKKVDVLIGDLDSISINFNKSSLNVIQHKKDKDYTDLDCCIEYAISRGYNVDVIGFFGKRIDHSLTNVFLLKKYNDKVTMIDSDNIVFYKNISFVLKAKKGYYFSLIPLCDIENLTIKHAKYNLDNTTIEFGKSILNSNEFVDKDVDIKFLKGQMLVVYSKK